MSVALFRGVKRPVAARFSFLLATPIIFGAGLFKLQDLAAAPDAVSQVPALLAGFAAAAVSGYACIWFLLRYLQKGKLYPFAVYCATMGLFCLLVLWLR
jgi:undecaprenyl-diphosphatase